MKNYWGTGIVVVLILFLMTMAGIIIFALNQDVNLVHKDYYEKGVDYSSEIKALSRSEQHRQSIKIKSDSLGIRISIDSALLFTIDSGRVLLYRPSGSSYDIESAINLKANEVFFPADKLISGRYIIKLYWYSKGDKFEVNQPVVW